MINDYVLHVKIINILLYLAIMANNYVLHVKLISDCYLGREVNIVILSMGVHLLIIAHNVFTFNGCCYYHKVSANNNCNYLCYRT